MMRPEKSLTVKIQVPASIEAGTWVPYGLLPRIPWKPRSGLLLALYNLQHAAQFILNVRMLWLKDTSDMAS